MTLITVPNDIAIGGGETNGILPFGTNASGKSSLMKGIGLNIIGHKLVSLLRVKNTI